MREPIILSRPAAELATGIVYFGLAASAISMTRFEGGAAFVWIATALLFARLSILPFSCWAVPIALCTLASVSASTLFGVGLVRGVPLGAVVVGEAAAAAWLLRRWLGDAAYYESSRGLFAFTVVAFLVPAVSGVLSYVSIGWPYVMPFRQVWFAWFAAHSLGTLVFAPIFVLAMRGEIRRWVRRSTVRRRVETAMVLLLVAGVTCAVFAQSRLPLLFLPALPIMVATLRLGRAGAAVSIVMLTAIGGVWTLHGIGPISLFQGTRGARVQLFQMYLAATTLLVLPVAALMKQYRQLLDRLSESEARYRLIAEHAGDLILNLTREGTILYASPALTSLLGYDPATVVGESPKSFIHPDDVARVIAMHARALAAPDGSFTVEYRAIAADGELRWCESNMRAVVDADGRVVGALSAIRDVNARKANEARLSAAANTDPLTGLPNRRAFAMALDERLQAVRDEGAVAALALFDIDFFKAINDRYGHAAGDAVLVAFATTARRSLRGGDCLARIGGEEFGLVLSAATPDEAEMVCERLRRALSAASVALPGGGTAVVTVSAGVTALAPDQDADAALRQADAALYDAKETGRNRLVRAA